MHPMHPLHALPIFYPHFSPFRNCNIVTPLPKPLSLLFSFFFETAQDREDEDDAGGKCNIVAIGERGKNSSLIGNRMQRMQRMQEVLFLPL